ncbi:MAG: hypothetical protein AAFY06_13050 [Pseudomonadota bacterium]
MEKPPSHQSPQEAAAAIKGALIAELASAITEKQQNTGGLQKWWERPFVPLMVAALIGGVGPIISAVADSRLTDATNAHAIETLKLEHTNLLAKLDREEADRKALRDHTRQTEFARLLMQAPTVERRLEILTLIQHAPGIEDELRDWAVSEQRRVVNQIETARKLAEERAEELERVNADNKRLQDKVDELTATLTAAQLRPDPDPTFDIAAVEREIETLRSRLEESKATPSVETRLDPLLATLPTLETEGVPRSFLLRAGIELLQGDDNLVCSFVSWRDTPQGIEFWSNECRRAEDGKQISQDARDIVQKWVDLASAD